MYPTREIATAAAAAAADEGMHYSSAFDDAAADYGYSYLADFVDAAAYAAGAAAAAAVDNTTAAVYSAAAAEAAAQAAAWEEIRSDASALESEVAVAELMAKPLWRAPPPWWEKERLAFQRKLKGLDLPNHGFAIWAEWYDDAAFGKPVFGIRSKDIRTALERNIALGSTDGTFNKAFWKRDPPEINADISRWVEEARQQDELERAIQDAPGTSWKATITGYQLHYAGDATDADVAQSAETAFEHVELNKVLEKLLQKSPAIASRQGWEDFHEAVLDMQSSVSCASAELHTRILQVYHHGLRLTTFLDQDNNLRANRGRNFSSPLEAPESRLLLQAIQFIHPWIGRFPTAKRKDIEAGQVYRVMTQGAIAAHLKLIAEARTVDLISEKDRALLQQFVEILSKTDLSQGVPAQKLQAHGAWTIKQLVYAMALHVAIAVPTEMATDVAKETRTWQVTKDFLVKYVKVVEEVVEDAPAHVQTIIRSIIAAEKDRIPNDVLPDSQNGVGDNRRPRRPRGKR